MKNAIVKGTTGCLLIFLIACSGSESPKGVAKNFLNAMNKLDFEGAKKYGTEDTGKLLDMMSGFIKMMPDSSKGRESKTEMIAEKIDGEKATVTYKEEGKNEEMTLDLVKVEGKWKVAMSKDNMNGGSGDMESGATNTEPGAQDEKAAVSDSTNGQN